MKPLEIYIVDDDRDDLDVMKTCLKYHPMSPIITEIQSPDECYEKLGNKKNPSIIFFDYKLPKETGVQCAQRCRELGWDGAAVLITGQFSDAIRSESIKSKAIDYEISKSDLSSGDKAPKTLDRFLETGICTQPLTIGIYGVGDQGRSIGAECLGLKNSRGRECVSIIKYFSNFWNQDDNDEYPDTLPYLHGDFEKKREKCCRNLDEFFGNPKLDVLFITTGMYKKKRKMEKEGERAFQAGNKRTNACQLCTKNRHAY